MRIRRVDRSDQAYFVEIYIQAYKNQDEYAYTRVRDIKAYFRWLYNRDKNGFFVAEIAEPVGFSACDTNWFSFYEMRKTAELHEIFVKPEFSGKGIGKELLFHSIRYAKSRDMPVISLWVGEKNERAKNFYKKHGFVESGRMGKWIRMKKNLSP